MSPREEIMKGRLYLGDGAYVDFTGHDFRIWTERATGIHEVFLDAEAISNLYGFAKRAFGQNQDGGDNEEA